MTAAWRARLPSRWALPTPQRGLKGGLIGVGPRLRFLYNGRTLRAISQSVLLLVALMVVLLMVAPHGAQPPDPPPYIGVFVPVPISPPGTAGLRAIPRHPVIADGYRYMPARIDSALARAVAENGHSLAGEVRVNWDKAMYRGDPYLVTMRVARRAVQDFEQGLQASFTKRTPGVEITTRISADSYSPMAESTSLEASHQRR